MNTSKKDLEETLRTAARSLLLDHGTSVKDILNVIRSQALRASTNLLPRPAFYESRSTGNLNRLAQHLLWKKKKDKSFPNVYDVNWDRGLIHDIADHFVYEKTKAGNLVISNRFKEYYIAEVLQTDDENSAPLNQGWETHRKRRRDDPIPPFAESKEEDKDLPPVMRKIVSGLRHNNEEHKNNPERGSKRLRITDWENPDRHALFEQIRPFVRNIPSVDMRTPRDQYNCAVFRQAGSWALPRIHDLVPYLKEGGKWPDRVEDLEHPGDVQRAKLQIGLKGASDTGNGPPVGMKEVPALADWELRNDDREGEDVHIDLMLKDFTLDGGVGMET
ncbi:hypothetical protein HK104_003815 [Borealophlyctis nickersoniae]|nr:hypothetical protein HK104_003815 [Borealophlyctis nickersoniae]